MGQVHVRVVLTHHREAVMARLGQLDASWVHRYETEAVTVEILGRKTEISPMVLGEQILLGVIVLAGLDLMIDGNRNRLVPYQGTWDQPVFRV